MSELISRVFGAVVIGLMSVAFVISFSALIYAGPLSDFLSIAIRLAMAGGAVMVIVGWCLHQLPVVTQTQEVTVLLIAGGAAIIASQVGQNAGPTVFVFVAIVTVSAGVLVYIFGRLRFGFLARFMPFPVLGGFMAATGYLLVMGAIGLAMDQHVGVWDLLDVSSAEHVVRWLPWLALSIVLAFVVRRTTSDLVLPLGVTLGVICFYAVAHLTEMSINDAMQSGLLLGPFPEAGAYTPSALIQQIDWGAIVAQWPIIGGVTALTIVGTLLNMSGLETALKQDTDFGHDLKAVGVSNVAAGLTGGAAGYPMIGETLLAYRFKLSGFVACLTVAFFCIAGAVFGVELLAFLPRGIFVTVIGFLGADLLIQWLWDERRGLHVRDRATIFLILLVAAFVGFLESILVGFVVASMIFVASYARLNPIRARSTLAAHRSVTERSSAEVLMLREEGQHVLILQLNGYLFFGSAYGISNRIRQEFESKSYNSLILDFTHVSGLDISAIKALSQIVDFCGAQDVRISLSALPDAVAVEWSSFKPTVYGALDDALLGEEEQILRHTGTSKKLEDSLERAFENLPPDMVTTRHLSANQVLFSEGDISQDLYLLVEGEMRAEVSRAQASPLVIARYEAGAILGEIAFYGLSGRTATIRSVTDVTLHSINPQALLDAGIDASHVHAAVARHLARRLTRTTHLVRQISV